MAREERLASIEAAASPGRPRRSNGSSVSSNGSATRRQKPARSSPGWKTLEKLDTDRGSEGRGPPKLKFLVPPIRRGSSRLVVEIEPTPTVGYDGHAGSDQNVEPGGRARAWKLALGRPERCRANRPCSRFIMGQLAPPLRLSEARSKRRRRLFRPTSGRRPRPVGKPSSRSSGTRSESSRRTATCGPCWVRSGSPATRSSEWSRDLSGGERTRLALAEIMCNPVNLLIPRRADEPPRSAELRRTRGRAFKAYPGHGVARQPRPVSDSQHRFDQLVDRSRRHSLCTNTSSVDEAVLSPPGSDGALTSRSSGSASPARSRPALKAKKNGSAPAAKPGGKARWLLIGPPPTNERVVGATNAKPSANVRKRRPNAATKRSRDTRDLRKNVEQVGEARLVTPKRSSSGSSRPAPGRSRCLRGQGSDERPHRPVTRPPNGGLIGYLVEWEEASTALERGRIGLRRVRPE